MGDLAHSDGQRRLAEAGAYGLAVLSVGAVVALRILTTPYFGDMSPFLSMAIAVFVSAWFGGIGSGVLAALLATVSAAFFFLQPVYSFKILRPEGFLEVCIFLVESGFIIAACRALRSSRARGVRQANLQRDTQRRLDAATVEGAQAKTSLQDRETLLRLITNSLPVAIAYLDAHETYRFCNQVYARWYGLTRDQIIGKKARDVVGEKIFAKVGPGLRKVLKGECVDVEDHVPYPERSRFVRIHKIPDVNPDGKVSGFVVLATDLSDQQHYQQELLKAKEDADAASRAKSAFLANMSHEIRTPLGAIVGFSDLLVNAVPHDPTYCNWIAAIKRNTDLLSNIISDILDLSKVEAGKISVERHEVALVEILTDVSMLLRLKAEENGLKLKIYSDGEVPAFVNTDPLRLRQILLNIVGNAIKFSPCGTVQVKLRLDAGKLAFDVTDSGPGITKEQASKLFEPFSQADISMKRKHGGTGLGLVLAKRLANLLGGDVVLAASTVGKGSTFAITIDPAYSPGAPMWRVENAEWLEERRPLPKAPTVRLDGLRVLVAEDSEDNRELLRRLLLQAGADIEMAVNGRDALDKVHHGDFDVVLMDIQMPEVDGIEATMALRDDGYVKPIVALTAHALKEERERYLSVGFSDHIAKPIDRNTLLGTLSHYVKRRTDGSSALLH